MSCKLKSIVVFLRILSNFILLTNCGKIKEMQSNLQIRKSIINGLRIVNPGFVGFK